MNHLLKIIAIALSLLSVSFINTESKDIIVVIDAGHGGHDVGATHNNFSEKDIVQQISKKIAILNKNENIKIYFTRTEDHFLELEKRTDYINNLHPDVVISLHVNQYKEDASSGFEVYVSDKNIKFEQSNQMATALISSLENKISLKNRGIKMASFWILKNSAAPAIVLALEFISNEKDRNYITTEQGQTEIGQGILDFVTTINK